MKARTKSAQRHDSAGSQQGRQSSHIDGSSASAVVPVVAPQQEAKKVVLQQALQQALSRSSKKGSSAHDGGDVPEMDVYGMGSPTDRLQFGYSPASHDEAIRFHALYSTSAWLAARKRNGHQVFVKHEKLKPTNCEPITTMLKLKRYWSRMQHFSDVLKEGATGMSVDAADAFLASLAEEANRGDEETDEGAATKPSPRNAAKKAKRARDDAPSLEDAESRAARVRRMEAL